MSVPYRTDPPARRARWPWLALVIGVLLVAWIVKGMLDGDTVKSGSGDAHGFTIIRYDVQSKAVGRTLPQVAASPPGGGRDKPLLVFLHGKGDDGQEANANRDFFKALAAQGDAAPNVVFPNGSNHSYWHNRTDGDWADYVLTEAIPMAIKKLHADPTRVAIGGISMGGYGAYELASEMPGGFCAVGGHSAATWVQGGQSAPGAFDDAEDFAKHDVIGLARAKGSAAWGKARLWLDNGDKDPFLQSDAAFAQALGIKQHVWPGAHAHSYWAAHYDDYLRFYSRALANC